MTDRFIIQVQNHTLGKTVYYAIDDMSGGYPYFTESMSQAERLTVDRVKDVLAEFALPNGPEGFPNSLAQNAGGISNKVLSADLEISVGTMVFQPDRWLPPIRRTYENKRADVIAQKAQVAAAAKAKLSPEELDALGIR